MQIGVPYSIAFVLCNLIFLFETSHLVNCWLFLIGFSNTNNYGASGVIYSTGWPYGYRSSSLPCEYRITVPYKYYGTFFVFMDIDLKDYGYADDSVQLYGE